MQVLFDTDEEFLVVALARCSIAQDGAQPGLDDGFKAFKHALGAGIACAEEGVDGLADAFAHLGRMSIFIYLKEVGTKIVWATYTSLGINAHVTLEPQSALARDAGLHGGAAVEEHVLELAFEGVEARVGELHHQLELLFGLGFLFFAVVQ